MHLDPSLATRAALSAGFGAHAGHAAVTTRRRRRVRSALAALLSLVAMADLLPGDAHGAGTDPLLIVDGARAIAAGSSAVTVEVAGRFSFDDLLQFSFPAGMIITRGTQWARFGLDGETTTGTDPAVADGLTAAEATLLLTAGAPADPPAAIVRVAPAEVAVALPASFLPGQATVVFYAVLEDETFLSNATAVVIP